MAEKKKKNWIQGAIKRPGAFTLKAQKAGMSVQAFAAKVLANPDNYDETTRKQAQLAKTFASKAKKGW